MNSQELISYLCESDIEFSMYSNILSDGTSVMSIRIKEFVKWTIVAIDGRLELVRHNDGAVVHFEVLDINPDEKGFTLEFWKDHDVVMECRCEY